MQRSSSIVSLLSVLPISPRRYTHQFANALVLFENFRRRMLRHGKVRLHEFRCIRLGDDTHHILFIAKATVPKLRVFIPPVCRASPRARTASLSFVKFAVTEPNNESYLIAHAATAFLC